LQKKFERFEKSDNNRLKLIWEMNEREAKAIVEKIIHADKVIHTQQLDIPWQPPKDPVFRALSHAQDPTSNDSFKGADSAGQGSQIHQQTYNESNNDQTISESGIKDPEQSRNSSAERNHADVALKFERIKNVFKMLIEECEFLIDDRAFERC
jgi:dynein regulatory complex protein 1